MRILTCIGIPDDVLEKYCPNGSDEGWELVISGFWSESPYHSGYIAYYIKNTSPGIWVMNGVERNAALDDITEVDIEEGNLNDDQIQAMWGMTLEEAQNQTYERIVAVLEGAPRGLLTEKASAHLYAAVRDAGGKVVDEPGTEGILVDS